MGTSTGLTSENIADGIVGSAFPTQLAQEFNACCVGLKKESGAEMSEVEPFCDEAFAAAFYMAASCDDPELLAKISAIFVAHPARAYAAVDRICEEKAKEATDATEVGDYVAAQAAIAEHHAMALVYGKLISARLEKISAQL